MGRVGRGAQQGAVRTPGVSRGGLNWNAWFRRKRGLFAAGEAIAVRMLHLGCDSGSARE